MGKPEWGPLCANERPFSLSASPKRRRGRTLQRHQCACAQVSPAWLGLVGQREGVRLSAGLTKPRGARGQRDGAHSASVRTHLRPETRPRSRGHTQAHAGTCMRAREQIPEHSPPRGAHAPRGYPAGAPTQVHLPEPARAAWFAEVGRGGGGVARA